MRDLYLSAPQIEELEKELKGRTKYTVSIQLKPNLIRMVRLLNDLEVEVDNATDLLSLGLNMLYQHRYAPPLELHKQLKDRDRTIRDLRAQLERMQRAAALVPEAPPSVKAETSTAEEVEKLRAENEPLQQRVCSLQAQIGTKDREIAEMTAQRNKAAERVAELEKVAEQGDALVREYSHTIHAQARYIASQPTAAEVQRLAEKK